jgi:hypothetical protein
MCQLEANRDSKYSGRAKSKWTVNLLTHTIYDFDDNYMRIAIIFSRIDYHDCFSSGRVVLIKRLALTLAPSSYLEMGTRSRARPVSPGYWSLMQGSRLTSHTLRPTYYHCQHRSNK